MNRREFLQVTAAGVLAATLGRLAEGEEAGVGAGLRKMPYILGADVSWLLEDEAAGATYWDRGEPKDLLTILKSYGFNWIRARIFVNPHAPGGYAAMRDQAFCDLEHTKKFAKRIKAAGLSFLLSFHYSDTWADPAHQKKPAAWAELPFEKLVSTVHEWSAGVLKALKENGTPPEMVSVGNETTPGMLWPDGRATDFDKFAELTNAGCMAVRDFDKSVLVALHNDRGWDNAGVRWWVDNFLKRKTAFDVLGLSCYEEHRPGDWKRNFNDLAVRYPELSLVAMEYSYHKRYLNDAVFGAPNGKGLGSFIWEPTRWKEAIFDHEGVNAGNDFGNRAHLPASTLPAIGAPDQPVYRPAKEPAAGSATRPAGGTTTGPATRRRWSRGGRYETNSYILAYPEMAKAYGERG
ncbi:MAG: glycosyl hydrolase 53 family protein [Phycisphaerae bacterium]